MLIEALTCSNCAQVFIPALGRPVEADEESGPLWLDTERLSDVLGAASQNPLRQIRGHIPKLTAKLKPDHPIATFGASLGRGWRRWRGRGWRRGRGRGGQTGPRASGVAACLLACRKHLAGGPIARVHVAHRHAWGAPCRAIEYPLKASGVV